MPRKSGRKTMTAKEKERRFISLYVERGAVAEKIPYCERRATLKAGAGAKILRRKSVKAEIKRLVFPIRAAQAQQATITQAVEKAKEVYAQELNTRLALIKLHQLDADVMIGRLMQGVVGLDINRQPEQVLEYIKTALVVKGTIESGRARRITPPENGSSERQGGIYMSLFNRLALNPKKDEPAPPPPADDVRDLFPGSTPRAMPPEDSLPPSGEAIDEPEQKPKAKSNIITVEVG